MATVRTVQTGFQKLSSFDEMAFVQTFQVPWADLGFLSYVVLRLQ